MSKTIIQCHNGGCFTPDQCVADRCGKSPDCIIGTLPEVIERNRVSVDQWRREWLAFEDSIG